MGKEKFLNNTNNTKINNRWKQLISIGVIRACANSIAELCASNNDCAKYIAEHIQEDIDQIIDYLLATEVGIGNMSDDAYITKIVVLTQKNISKLIHDKYIDYFNDLIVQTRIDRTASTNASVLVE